MIDKEELKKALGKLGLKKGSLVMVHSALSSLGRVKGGADTVIAALLEVLGNNGTLAMPTFSSPDRIFNYRCSPTKLGKINDTFWRQKGVKRSLHPTHSVAACGSLAERLLRGHEKADTAYGVGTPYKRLADLGGYILLIGVDLDRTTALHTVEAICDAPYLTTVKSKYLDRKGKEIEISIAKMAGPHRDFIGLDKKFRENGIMQVGRIGNSACRLIDADKMLKKCVNWMKQQPELMLCSNQACYDCQLQRGQIKRELLKQESFQLSVSTQEISDDLNTILKNISTEGIDNLEIGRLFGRNILALSTKKLKEISLNLFEKKIKVSAIHLEKRTIASWVKIKPVMEKALETGGILKTNRIIFSIPACTKKNKIKYLETCRKIAELGQKNNITFLLENIYDKQANLDTIMDIIEAVDSKNLRLAYNPANYAMVGGRPFLNIVAMRKVKKVFKYIEQIYINDSLYHQLGKYMQPGCGNAEIKELISIHRCKNFTGVLTFKAGGEKEKDVFKDNAAYFWGLLSKM